MEDYPQEIAPGDPIKAEWLNQLLRAIKRNNVDVVGRGLLMDKYPDRKAIKFNPDAFVGEETKTIAVVTDLRLTQDESGIVLEAEFQDVVVLAADGDPYWGPLTLETEECPDTIDGGSY